MKIVASFLDTILWKPESEVIEFKLAKDDTYPTDKIFEYVSALANEANLKQKENAYLVFGVEPKKHVVVGTNYREDSARLDSTKQQIFQSTKHSVDIYAIEYNWERLVIFEIPPSPQGVVIESNWFAYAREWESLVSLSRSKREQIEAQGSKDWSIQIIPEATLEDLSPEAIEKARTLYKVKNRKDITEVDGWDNETFLNKAKLTIKWKITRTAILLLWKPESNQYLTPGTSEISWILKDKDNNSKDYEHFSCPLILSVNEIYGKIRNLKYRYMSGETLFPEEVDQYDPYIIREALNNCIAHQDYNLWWKIVIVENEDGNLIFTNSGLFIPESVEKVVTNNAPESHYRNRYLSDAMVNLNLIDTIWSWIRKMFFIQKNKFFPLPEYEIKDKTVKVTITGKVLDMKYARKLAQMPNLKLEEIILLDKVQKWKHLEPHEIKCLKLKNLIEWRNPNIYISSHVAQETWQKSDYIKLRGLKDDHYKKLILEYLSKYKTASKKDIDKLILDILPKILDEKQKWNKVRNIIYAMSKKDKTIINTGTLRNPIWKKIN